MNPQDIGNFIKKIRKENNLTQKEFADMYHVTYQAVSKWENGINIPEISLLHQMSKDFNISIEDILNGKKTNKKKSKLIIIISVIVLIVLLTTSFLIYKHYQDKHNYSFKSISTSCNEFEVIGSIVYDNKKSSIKIQKVNYCGKKDNTTYKKIECSLYEKNNNTNKLISNCDISSSTTLDNYLDNVKINVDNYFQTCNNYNDESLYLQINAVDNDNKTISYKIPLVLNNDCPGGK